MQKKQIALLVDQAENNFSIEICRGAKAAALQEDLELFILYGGYVEETTEIAENVYKISLKRAEELKAIGVVD